MSITNIIERERATYVGEEESFGVTPAGSFPNAMTRILTIGGDVDLTVETEMLDDMDERVRRLDAIHPIRGLEMASKFGLSYYLKATPSANQLTASGTVGSLSPGILLRHALGTEHAEIGTTVATGASATAFDATSTATLEKGDWIAVTISSVPEYTKITNIASSTITVSPALSGTPANGAIVRNLRNYVPAESHANSLTVQRGYVGDSTAQYTLNGCYGSLTFSLEMGKLPTLKLDLTATKNTTGAQALSVATASDEMGTPMVFKDALVYLATSITRGTTLSMEKVEVTFPNEWQIIRDPSGIETLGGVVNTAGRPRAGTLKVTTRYDADWQTGFAADTGYDFLLVIRSGSGATMSHWIVECPNVKLTKQPTPTKVAGELLGFELEFSLLQDDGVTVGSSTGADLDRVYAPLRIAYG